jgi:hypothetical protein
MPNPNIGQIVADAWELTAELGEYGYAVGTIGWHRGLAYRRTWDWRTGDIEWRRLPHRDTATPPPPNPQHRLHLFYSLAFMDELRPRRHAVITGLA